MLLDDLSSGRIDVALLALPYPLNELKKVELYDDRFHLACLPEHPLANVKSLKVKHLASQPMRAALNNAPLLIEAMSAMPSFSP